MNPHYTTRNTKPANQQGSAPRGFKVAFSVLRWRRLEDWLSDMITALAHVCLQVRDLAATRMFYVDLLGLPVAFEFQRQGSPFGYYFKVAERNFIEVFHTDKVPAEGPVRIAHFCLETSNMEGLRARLLAAGKDCSEPKLGADQSWQFWCKDPDGNNIEFHHYTDASLQFNGGVAVVDW